MDCPINATKPLKRKDTAYYYDYIKDDDFLKGLVLSPDGSLLLASSENSCDAVIAELNHDELVSTKYYKNVCDSTSNENTGRLTSDRLLRNFQMFSLGESVYDLKWYPGCTVQDPATCCFVAATKDHPVHLWDTNSQSIRCSYIPKNHMDELDNAISLSFNLTGDKIYMGSNKIIR